MTLLQDIEPPSSNKTIEAIKNLFKRKLSGRARVLLANSVNILTSCSKKAFRTFAVLPKIIEDSGLFNRYLPHFAILFLSMVVLVSNLTETVKAKALQNDLINIEPDTEYSIVTSVERFTSVISNDSEIITKAEEAKLVSDGFATVGAPIDTQITERVEPLPDNSTSSVYYVIRDGDTLTGLGWKFGVKIATIKFVNDLNNVNSIRPGVKLKIPQRGYEVSQSEILKKEKANQAKLAAASRNTVTRNTSTSRSVYNGSYNGSGGINLTVPINYKYISRGLQRGHNGIDYVAGVGTAVYAACDGVVIQTATGWSGGYGNMIVVSHGGGVATRYAHLSKILISSGEAVSKGQVIGYSGNSGRSTGPHLHFEKIVNGHTVNPF